MDNEKANSYQVVDNNMMTEMFNKGRLDYILAVEDDRYGKLLKLEDKYYQKLIVQKISAYHFINKKLAYLVPALTIAIQDALDN